MSLPTGAQLQSKRFADKKLWWGLTLREDNRKFLPEVQGLRAVAVLMVVTYHVWFGRISGGVDIFLLISAFLLTGQFVRKLENGRALDLFRYWAHLFKRLLPMVVLVLLATIWASHAFLPETRWMDIIHQTWASLFYYQNWYLAAESVNYYAADHSVASPLQHIWSLSIQGQIFIIWPLIFALAAWIAKRGRLRIRAVLLYLFGAVFVASLTFSIITTQTTQAFAYFDTRTRLWEFALGSLLALVLPYLGIRRELRIFMGWFGVVAMLSCGIILQVGQQFPGYMALWPTLAAACIIVAGSTGSRVGADKLLSWKPLVKLGDSSYALYLIHWPLLVFFLVVSGRDQAGPKAGTALILVSIILAILVTRFIDTPLRKNKWIERKRIRAVATIAVCVAVVAAPLVVWQARIDAKQMAVQAQIAAAQSDAIRNYPGALALAPGYVDKADPGLPMAPPLTALDKQWVTFEGGLCTGDLDVDKGVLTGKCSQTTTVGKPSKTVIVVGDSHAQQISGALEVLAKKNNWQLVALLLGGCDFGDESTPSGRGKECVDFNAAAISYVKEHKPDAVVTMSTRTVADSADEAVLPGYASALRTFSSEGIPVIGIRDNPRFVANMASCVDKSGAEACAFSQASHLAATDPAESLSAIPNAHMIDLTDQFCADGSCSPVVGNVLVYMDQNHITWDYSKTLAPALGTRMAQSLNWDIK